MKTSLIILKEYCAECGIEPSFITQLEEEGLINIQEIEQEHYIEEEQLLDLEKYTKMYYDLSINIEGIGAISHLLDRLQAMQSEIADLRNTLIAYGYKDF